MEIVLQIALMAFMALCFIGALGAKSQKERVTFFIAGLVMVITLIVTIAVF